MVSEVFIKHCQLVLVPLIAQVILKKNTAVGGGLGLSV